MVVFGWAVQREFPATSIDRLLVASLSRLRGKGLVVFPSNTQQI
jgi:hypothetical protein